MPIVKKVKDKSMFIKIKIEGSLIYLTGEMEDLKLVLNFLRKERFGLPRNIVKSLKEGSLKNMTGKVKYYRKYPQGFEFKTIIKGDGINEKNINI